MYPEYPQNLQDEVVTDISLPWGAFPMHATEHSYYYHSDFPSLQYDLNGAPSVWCPSEPCLHHDFIHAKLNSCQAMYPTPPAYHIPPWRDPRLGPTYSFEHNTIMDSTASFEVPGCYPHEHLYPAQITSSADNYIAPAMEQIHTYHRLPSVDTRDQAYTATTSFQGQRYTFASNALEHRIRKSSVKFACDVCDARFSCESSAKRHQQNQFKRFRCDICKQMFARLDYRNWHQRRCHRSRNH